MKGRFLCGLMGISFLLGISAHSSANDSEYYFWCSYSAGKTVATTKVFYADKSLFGNQHESSLVQKNFDDYMKKNYSHLYGSAKCMRGTKQSTTDFSNQRKEYFRNSSYIKELIQVDWVFK